MDDKIINEENIEEAKKQSKKEKYIDYIKSFATLIIAIVSVVLVKRYIVTPVEVNGSSMYPTLEDGDIMMLNRVGFKLSNLDRFDIVVIDNGDSLLIKRIIGLPNEKIKVENNVLYINGEKVDEPFLDESVLTRNFEYINGEDCYFVMGDNREVSLDSRMLGCFNIKDIKGTASFTLYPFNRLGSKN